MNCKANESCNLKINLGFKLHDVINTKEQTIINSIKDAFEGEDMQTQYTVFINTNLQLKLMNQVIMMEILTMKYKDNKHQKENLLAYLLELILTQQILTFLKK